MALLTNQKRAGIKVYDMISDNAQKKLFALSHKLGIDKMAFEKHNKWGLWFYDTPDNLLTKAGVLLYRTIENDKHFLKMEKLAFLANVGGLRKSEIFELSIAPKDTPNDQAFYLISGITEMFSTQFSIDLENVIKKVVPKLKVSIRGTSYKGFRGDGFKCLVEFQKVKYKNLVTKRKHKCNELTVTQISGKSFDDEFKGFLGTLEKYCKDILPHKESRYDKGMRLTQPINRQPKTKDKAARKAEKAKRKAAEHKIEG